MKIEIAANIKTFRKERKLTQEQLAEAMGVTVGAVSRWESGSTTPDLSTLMELAGFFDTSVDVLLGYTLQNNGLKDQLGRIRTLRNEKHFDEATADAERLLLRYPNSFEAVFSTAILYSLKGVEQEKNAPSRKKNLRRSLELFERSLELIEQNTDVHINRWTIRNNIADVLCSLGNTGRALDEMKDNNAAGLNDANIGFILALEEHKPQEALPYLSSALVNTLGQLDRVMLGYINAYGELKEHAHALSAAEWICDVMRPLKRVGAVSEVNMMLAQNLAVCACAAGSADKWENAEEYLRAALAEACVFDAAPDYSFKNMPYFTGNEVPTAFSDFGATAQQGIEKLLMMQETQADKLIGIWEKIKSETR